MAALPRPPLRAAVSFGGDASSMLEWSTHLPVVTFPAGVEVLRAGEVHGLLLVLVEGTVEVSRHDTLVAAIDEPGSIFGEMSAQLGGPATATLRSRDACRFHRCEDSQAFLTEEPGVALAVAATLARRRDTITGHLVDLRTQYADHLGMVDTVLGSLVHHQGRAPDPGSEREPDHRTNEVARGGSAPVRRPRSTSRCRRRGRSGRAQARHRVVGRD